MLRFDVFFSSRLGTCFFKLSKHSFKCARLAEKHTNINMSMCPPYSMKCVSQTQQKTRETIYRKKQAIHNQNERMKRMDPETSICRSIRSHMISSAAKFFHWPVLLKLIMSFPRTRSEERKQLKWKLWSTKSLSCCPKETTFIFMVRENKHNSYPPGLLLRSWSDSDTTLLLSARNAADWFANETKEETDLRKENSLPIIEWRTRGKAQDRTWLLNRTTWNRSIILRCALHGFFQVLRGLKQRFHTHH